MLGCFILSIVYLFAICGWSHYSPMTYHDYGMFLALVVLALQLVLLGLFVFAKD
jgi:hypothetical protein